PPGERETSVRRPEDRVVVSSPSSHKTSINQIAASVKCLLFPFGSSGDVFPFVGLALALQERGHEATVVTNGHFRETIERTGLQFIESGTEEEFLEQTNNPDIWDPLRGFSLLIGKGVAGVLEQQWDFIEREADEQTLLIGSAFGFAPRLAQEKHGIPFVTVHLQPAAFWSVFQSPRLPNMLSGIRVPHWLKGLQYNLGERFVLDRAALPVLNPFRRKLGLPPVKRITRWWHSPECVLGLFPEWFAAPQPDWPDHVHLCEFPLWDPADQQPLSEELLMFLEDGEPPVVITPGSGNQHGKEMLREAMEACHQLGRRTLLMTRYSHQWPSPLASGAAAFPFAPFSKLLPRAAGIVHQGGIGTTSQAMRAGIPQLIMPMCYDQPDNAERISRLEIGKELVPKQFRRDRIANALGPLLSSPLIDAACRQISDRLAAETPYTRALSTIEELCQKRFC
ncbi:MAG: glycosyltransferase family 1 protein, partial [Planctomycetaceae bacterium]|nr:glycosyltransferase family 1 protein [Planctomycetaceae bacterium]